MKSLGFHFETTYQHLPKCFYTCLVPSPVSAPNVVVLNTLLAETLGLCLTDLPLSEQAALFSGNTLLDEATYFAMAYAGHQFGHFTQLGDGRALMWGEHLTPDKQRVDIQFKGSGPTPYSRRGDGRAALGPMLREYLISEAMHYLGIPTSRSLAVVTTGETIRRDGPLPGSILTRVASSHLRIGTFEFAAIQDSPDVLEALLEYTLTRHYPKLMQADNKALALLNAVIEKQAALIVHWMRVGFIHGVMNTDNMTLSGETIDYGPCAFIDNYYPATVFSSIDHAGRYAYQNQPAIAQWNLARFAETLLPHIHKVPQTAVDLASESLHRFSALYQEKWLNMMRTKLGLSEAYQDDAALINDLLAWMQSTHADYTNTFRDLSQCDKPIHARYQRSDFSDWYQRWQRRRQQEALSLNASVALMLQANPAIIPRNHKVEEALSAANEDNLEPLFALLELLKTPYASSEKHRDYQRPPSPTERVYQTFCGT